MVEHWVFVSALQNRDRQEADPICYLITFACYGTWIPGTVGVVPRSSHLYGAPLPEADDERAKYCKELMSQEPYALDSARREVVLGAIMEVCTFRSWTLLASHVRTNHVHAVVWAPCKPEPILTAFKSYSSRALNRRGLDAADRQRWARHGSTRYLWNADSVRAAIDYVVRGQGEPMAVYEKEVVR
jgi:REP element-mobilizing transposase RayT